MNNAVTVLPWHYSILEHIIAVIVFDAKQLCGVPEKLHDIRLLHTDFCNYTDSILMCKEKLYAFTT